MPIFLCGYAADHLLTGMASGVAGALGFQIMANFGTWTRFSLCLSSSHGILFIGGGGRSNSLPCTAISKWFAFAPLITALSGDSPHDYRINLSSKDINGVPLSPNTSSPPYIARLSTMIPYTTMLTPLFKAFSVAYLDTAMSSRMKTAKVVKPFGLCFELSREGQGDRTLAIDLVLLSKMVRLTIQGRNSMVRAVDWVVCLRIVDGGVSQEDEVVVIGWHQLEEVFPEFNFGRSMLGFSPSLVSMGTSSEEIVSDL